MISGVGHGSPLKCLSDIDLWDVRRDKLFPSTSFFILGKYGIAFAHVVVMPFVQLTLNLPMWAKSERQGRRFITYNYAQKNKNTHVSQENMYRDVISPCNLIQTKRGYNPWLKIKASQNREDRGIG